MKTTNTIQNFDRKKVNAFIVKLIQQKIKFQKYMLNKCNSTEEFMKRSYKIMFLEERLFQLEKNKFRFKNMTEQKNAY